MSYLVFCINCGHEQLERGKGATCDACGWKDMPYDVPLNVPSDVLEEMYERGCRSCEHALAQVRRDAWDADRGRTKSHPGLRRRLKDFRKFVKIVQESRNKRAAA